MNLEDFTWFNQQLAAMLREGVPVADALRQLARTQGQGRLQGEFLRIESALSSGVPLDRAVAGGSLPPLYVHLVQAGVRSGDLAGALTLAVDHYSALNEVWRRAKALLVYPVLVTFVGLGLSLLLWRMYRMTASTFGALVGETPGVSWNLTLALVPMVFALIALGMGLALGVPALRKWLVWRLPGFREARTANFASGMSLMLQQGCPLPDALALMGQLEAGSPAGPDLETWQLQLRSGHTGTVARPEEWEALPAMLGWFLRSAGGNLAEGFGRAARFYRERAVHRLDLLLHGALPLLLILLGFIVGSQVLVIFKMAVQWLGGLGGDDFGP